MKYINRYLFFFTFFLGIWGIWGCDLKKVDSVQMKTPEVKEAQRSNLKIKNKKAQAKTKNAAFQFWYSPFVIDVESPKMAFEIISFKDVTQGEISKYREEEMETLAELLRASLESDPIFKARSTTRYDISITDPANHKACGEKHLYIDVWSSTEGWGYSLWSGCSEDSNFAKSTVKVPPTENFVDRSAPLVKDITASLHKAHKADCFLKSC